MAKAVKTNAARRLDQLAIAYRIARYDVDPDDLSAGSVAAKLGRSADEIFKTLVLRGDRHGPCFAVIAGADELDLKALAAASGDRRVEMVPLKEVQGMTGYIRGGVTVLAAKKAFAVYADAKILRPAEIMVSAGQRGLQLCLKPDDYLRATKAAVAEIARSRLPIPGDEPAGS